MVSYGGGANSTALLIGLHQHRIPVDLILFADTGAEHPHTYAYLEVMDSWLKDHGMPPITRVYKTTRDGKRLTLEDECLQSCSLPSIAYGFKRCSLKHKIGPQEKFCNHYPPCQKVWAAGKRVVKFIGYDAGEGYRSDKVLLGDLADRKYSKWYPLMEWGWTRDDCIRQIEAAGLPQPGKSSCFFCPSMKPDEITAYISTYLEQSGVDTSGLTPDGLTVKVRLRQGVYHQIKRMFGVYGAGVNALHREAIGGLALDAQLAPGQWRELSDEEVAKITR